MMNNKKEKTPSIALIGGMEITIENKPSGQLQFGSENPGTIAVHCRGRVWNLALSLTGAGCAVDLISAAGNDFAGQSMKAQLGEKGVSVGGFHLIDGQNTAAEHVILNLLDQPEMEFQNKDVFDCLSIDKVKESIEQIASADCIVLDTCFPEDTMAYIAEAFSPTPILLWPDSPDNVLRAGAVLSRMKGVLTGRREGELLSEMEILSEEQLKTASQWFREQGLEQVYFYLGNGGIYYNDASGCGLAAPGSMSVADVVRGFASGKNVGDIASV